MIRKLNARGTKVKIVNDNEDIHNLVDKSNKENVPAAELKSPGDEARKKQATPLQDQNDNSVEEEIKEDRSAILEAEHLASAER